MAKKKPQAGKPPISYMQLSRLLHARLKEFVLQSIFKFGYRNKEDVSNLPANTLVVGSQNVLTNAAEQVTIRQGYALDGSAGSQNTYGIDSSYDFETSLGAIQNLRKWGSTLQMRYDNPVTSVVTWVTISASVPLLSASRIAVFSSFYNTTEASRMCLFVNGDNNVYEWSGASAAYLSATATTVTVSGTSSLAQLGFYGASADTGKMQFVMNGVTYTYTGRGVSTTTAFSQAPTNNKTAITTTQWFSQIFTTGAAAVTAYTASVVINSAAGNSLTSNFTAGIYTDSAGTPGTLVGQATGSIPGAYSAGDFTVSFTFTNLTVSTLTNYHLVVHSDQTGTDLTAYTGNNGAAGTKKSTDTGVTWGAVNGYLNAIVTENDVTAQTFVGVSPNPNLVTNTVGDAVIQLPVIGTTTAGINISPNGTAFPSLWTFDLIATLENQAWYGCKTSSLLYVSATDNYKDISFGTASSTVRLPSQGALIRLDAPTVGFSPEGTQMYAAAGRDQWWVSEKEKLTVTIGAVATATEILYMARIKTSHNQTAQAQSLIVRFKNSLVYVSNEQIINAIGLVKNVYTEPQVVNMSDSIKYDIDAYDFTNGHAYYDNYFLYFAVPEMGIVRMYNVTKKYWEAPQTIPISRFYHVTSTIGTLLYGHSSMTDESYQLFTGYNDNGNPISSAVAFPYVSQQGGSANQKKNFNKIYTEGYIAANTTLMLTVNYDFGGFSGTYTTTIKGTDTRIIFNRITDGSLGQQSLGSQPIGSILNLPNQPAIPKFRVINTMPRLNFYEYQLVYSTDDVDQNYALLRLGPAISSASDISVEITE